MKKHLALTVQQVNEFWRDLEVVKQKAAAIAALVYACYGQDSDPVIRAAEVESSIQRLERALERAGFKKGGV